MVQSVYLCGSITKRPDTYVQEFRTAAAVLRSDGFDVANPVELDDPAHAAEALDDPYGERYEELLARDLDLIASDKIDAVVVLPGWEESNGAYREVQHARSIGKPVLEYPSLKPSHGAMSVPIRRGFEPGRFSTLPANREKRKNIPITTGCLDYFPNALAAVAEVSRVGNDQHNPGEPMHHARGKSTDHADCIVRHLFDRGTVDPEDGVRHSAKVAWRALALLQEELEREEGVPLARGAKVAS